MSLMMFLQYRKRCPSQPGNHELQLQTSGNSGNLMVETAKEKTYSSKSLAPQGCVSCEDERETISVKVLKIKETKIGRCSALAEHGYIHHDWMRQNHKIRCVI